MKSAEMQSETAQKTLGTVRLDLTKREEDTCPECGSDSLVRQGRCSTCYTCGWSKCSV